MSYYDYHTNTFCYGCFWNYPVESPVPYHFFTQEEETEIFRSARDPRFLCELCYKKSSPDLDRTCTVCGKRCELTQDQKRFWTLWELVSSLYEHECEECWERV